MLAFVEELGFTRARVDGEDVYEAKLALNESGKDDHLVVAM